MTDVLIWLLLFISAAMMIISFVLASFGLSFLVGAPFVATPKKIAREMLEFAEFKPGETIIDLGSGDGSILFVAAEEFGADRAIGYEINPILVIISNLRTKWRKNIHIKTIRANFFSRPVEQVDVIATYLWPSTMDRLVDKLRSELSPETRVISRGFQFKQSKPEKELIGSKSRLYLYRVGDL
ncbi:MAG: 50S ribosomal protein L11 methyltransferase [Patescibacteria group bacterium]